jgi:hypothetical protein
MTTSIRLALPARPGCFPRRPQRELYSCLEFAVVAVAAAFTFGGLLGGVAAGGGDPLVCGLAGAGLRRALSRRWVWATWEDLWGDHRNAVLEGPPLVRHERGMEVWT